MVLIDKDNYNGTKAGLMMSAWIATDITIFYYFVLLNEINEKFISLERLMDYLGIPSERKGTIKNNELKQNWPVDGTIVFNNFSTRYREGLDLVVKDLNVTIKNGEKIGVCGRTGAGKSTIILSILRVLEATQGNILIDDIDISKLDLKLLRQKITLIPQNPILFEDSLKVNLDPTA